MCDDSWANERNLLLLMPYLTSIFCLRVLFYNSIHWYFFFCTFQVQLKVTPRVEGILQIVGVRWNLSGAVVGFHNFGSNLMKKKNAKGRRRGNRSLNDNLKFVVIKVHGLFGSQPSTKAPPSTKTQKISFHTS